TRAHARRWGSAQMSVSPASSIWARRPWARLSVYAPMSARGFRGSSRCRLRRDDLIIGADLTLSNCTPMPLMAEPAHILARPFTDAALNPIENFIGDACVSVGVVTCGRLNHGTPFHHHTPVAVEERDTSNDGALTHARQARRAEREGL